MYYHNNNKITEMFESSMLWCQNLQYYPLEKKKWIFLLNNVNNNDKNKNNVQFLLEI